MIDTWVVVLWIVIVLAIIAAVVNVSFGIGYKAGHEDAQQERAAVDMYHEIAERQEREGE